MKTLLGRVSGVAVLAILGPLLWGCGGTDSDGQSADVAEGKGASSSGQTEAEEIAELERYRHEIDLMSVVKRFLSPEGYVDPEFPATVAKPSPHLTDFYGALAIGDVSRDRIIVDFVPKYAELTTEDEHSVTLTFVDGFTAVFYPISTLVVAGAEAPVSHVVLSGDTWQAAGENVETLIGNIREIRREDAYLVDNPFYDLEKKTYEVMQSGVRASVAIDAGLSQFRASENGILLFPEKVHGVSTDADELMNVLNHGGIEWVGFESLMTSQQDDLDAFNDAVAGTPEYEKARAELVDYYADAWNGRAGPKTTGEENFYFKLCEAAHAAGVRVIALEGSTVPFLFFRYGETAFGAAVRSLIWANASPSTGRGVLFGGSAHFNYPDVPMVQDLIAAEQPERPFFSLKDLWKTKEQ